MWYLKEGCNSQSRTFTKVLAQSRGWCCAIWVEQKELARGARQHRENGADTGSGHRAHSTGHTEGIVQQLQGQGSTAAFPACSMACNGVTGLFYHWQQEGRHSSSSRSKCIMIQHNMSIIKCEMNLKPRGSLAPLQIRTLCLHFSSLLLFHFFSVLLTLLTLFSLSCLLPSCFHGIAPYSSKRIWVLSAEITDQQAGFLTYSNPLKLQLFPVRNLSLLWHLSKTACSFDNLAPE